MEHLHRSFLLEHPPKRALLLRAQGELLEVGRLAVGFVFLVAAHGERGERALDVVVLHQPPRAPRRLHGLHGVRGQGGQGAVHERGDVHRNSHRPPLAVLEFLLHHKRWRAPLESLLVQSGLLHVLPSFHFVAHCHKLQLRKRGRAHDARPSLLGVRLVQRHAGPFAGGGRQTQSFGEPGDRLKLGFASKQRDARPLSRPPPLGSLLQRDAALQHRRGFAAACLGQLNVQRLGRGGDGGSLAAHRHALQIHRAPLAERATGHLLLALGLRGPPGGAQAGHGGPALAVRQAAEAVSEHEPVLLRFAAAGRVLKQVQRPGALAIAARAAPHVLLVQRSHGPGALVQQAVGARHVSVQHGGGGGGHAHPPAGPALLGCKASLQAQPGLPSVHQRSHALHRHLEVVVQRQANFPIALEQGSDVAATGRSVQAHARDWPGEHVPHGARRLWGFGPHGPLQQPPFQVQLHAPKGGSVLHRPLLRAAHSAEEELALLEARGGFQPRLPQRRVHSKRLERCELGHGEAVHLDAHGQGTLQLLLERLRRESRLQVHLLPRKHVLWPTAALAARRCSAL
mmetsp:Transcript_19436/g.37518  ORF Transcript_19436/g.37518 Transcript_19436/m.37518 type:complete len:569 (-) Transcript_19436:132-1838(-)